MKRLLWLISITALFATAEHSIQAQTAPVKLWDKTFGSSNEDILYCLQQTSDGGYVLGGSSKSGLGGDKTQSNRGPSGDDYWVVKVDANGNKLWDKTFGGSGYDDLFSLRQTPDGGYILGGRSDSPAGGDKSQAAKGYNDYWVLKLGASGNKLWDKTLGGYYQDILYSIQLTSDGGYIMGGESTSGIGGDKTQVSRGLNDYWVVKLDANGNKLWDKTFGGSDNDLLLSIQQTSDGGYIMGGESTSGIGGDKSEPNRGISYYSDYWVVKLDANGNKLWDKTFGGTDDDQFYSLQQTSDGGYILGGDSKSGVSGDKTKPLLNIPGYEDYWVIKLDASGNKLWDKAYGGSSWDGFHSLQQTIDGGYILAGYSPSPISGDKSQNPKGSADYWVIKVDANGNKTWDKTIGGTGYDAIYFIQQTSDEGYIMGGYSESGFGADKSQASRGHKDYWVVRLAAPCSALTATLSTSCNSNGTNVNLNVNGIQPGAAGTPFWTLTFKVNGVSQSVSGTTPAFTLAQNATPGSVYSIVNITSGTCTANLTDSLVVEAIPVAPGVIPGSNCGAGSVTLSATGAPIGGSYLWYATAAGGTALFTNPSGTFTTPNLSATTTYYVAVTNNVGCEGPRIAVTVTIKTFTVNAGSKESLCANSLPVQFTGFSPADGNWSGAGVSASGIFTPNSNLAGSQTLTYTVTQDGCQFSASKEVTVLKPVSLGGDLNACEGEELTLKADKGNGSFLWKDGSTNSSFKVKQSGEYWVQHSFNGCMTSDTIQVTFTKCPEPFIPNIITPNSDKKNDFFNPQYLTVGNWQLKIYNRWGVKLFESENYQNNWPDKKISDGTYYYLLRNSKTGQQYKGWLEVVQ